MTYEQQLTFAQELIDRVKEEVLSAIAYQETPDTWDGHELREYIAEKFSGCRSTLMREKRSKRRSEYRNYVLVNNL